MMSKVVAMVGRSMKKSNDEQENMYCIYSYDGLKPYLRDLCNNASQVIPKRTYE